MHYSVGSLGVVHSSLQVLYYEQHKTRPLIAPTTTQLQDTLLEVLSAGRDAVQTFLIFDALDEIPFGSRQDQRRSIVDLLNKLATASVANLHMIAMSRPHEDLRHSLLGGWQSLPIASGLV